MSVTVEGLGPLIDLATALGLVRDDGQFDTTWFASPGDHVGNMLRRQSQREALLRADQTDALEALTPDRLTGHQRVVLLEPSADADDGGRGSRPGAHCARIRDSLWKLAWSANRSQVKDVFRLDLRCSRAAIGSWNMLIQSK